MVSMTLAIKEKNFELSFDLTSVYFKHVGGIFSLFLIFMSRKAGFGSTALSPMSLTWAKNLLLVLLTLVNSFSSVCHWPSEQFLSGVVDSKDKFYAFWLFLTGLNDTWKNSYCQCQQHQRKTVVTIEVCSFWKTANCMARKRTPPKKTAISPAAGVRHDCHSVTGTAKKVSSIVTHHD